MNNRKYSRVVAALLMALGLVPVAQAQGTDAEKFDPAQIRVGEKTYSLNCAPCHGTRMNEPPVSVDLKQFPKNQRSKFLNTVTNGRNTMPPWRGALTPEEIEALWAYVAAGEPN